jgi:hypothetical protein
MREPGGAESSGKPMRRADKEIKNPEELAAALSRARYLCLGIADMTAPYIVPLFFGYEQGRIYIHCARDGRKLDLIREHPRVGFAAVEEPEIVEGDSPCDFSARSQSVIGHGIARVVEEEGERKLGLDAIMRHYSAGTPVYSPQSLKKTRLISIDIEEMRGKRIG